MITLERFIADSDLVHRREPRPTTSPAAEIPIAQCIRTSNASLFWSMRLLPQPRREAMQALYVLCHEVRDIANGNASPTLKLTLLADWRDQIALLYAGRPQHVVTRALRNAIERFDLRSADFLAIIDGMKMISSTDIRAPSIEQLDLYCEQTAAAVSRIALRVFGATSPEDERLAAALGRGVQLTDILRNLVEDATRQRLYLPRELLHAHGIFATMPSYVLATGATAGLQCACRASSSVFCRCRVHDRSPPKRRDVGGKGDALQLSRTSQRLARSGLVAARRAGAPHNLAPNGAAHRTRFHRSLISEVRRRFEGSRRRSIE